MPTPVKKKFCTIYRRSEAEKRAFNQTKEIDSLKSEIEELKKMVASSSTTSSKSSKKKSSATTEE